MLESKKIKLNMINIKGEEEEKTFILKPFPDKWEFYEQYTTFKAIGSFPGAIHFAKNTFPKCVEGIDVVGFEGKYNELLKEFFINDPEALDILILENVNFQLPSIKRR